MTTLEVNGKRVTVEADADTPLLYVLRNDLALNGAKYGCGLGQCGACTVLVDGQPAFSCLVPIAALENRRVTTLEGLGTPEAPSQIQRAFVDEQAAQCGFCIPGMILRAQALLLRGGAVTDAEIRRHMQPNLCRCGTHQRILKAVKRAAESLQTADASVRRRP